MKNKDQIQAENVDRDLVQHSLSKAMALTKYCAVVYLIFGFLSWQTIASFKSELSLWANVWPRFIFVSLPFVALYISLKNSKRDDVFKLSMWCITFSMINAFSACVYVWPIAYAQPDILLYFSSVNNLIFVCTGVYLVLPNRVFYYFLASWSLFFFLPLLLISKSNELVFGTIVTDVIVYSTTLFFLKSVLKRNYQKPIEEKFQHFEKSGRFLDEDVNRALIHGKDLASLSGNRRLFMLQIDIRGYTEFLKTNRDNQELLRNFTRDLSALVRGTTKRLQGRVHKTLGDGYHCFFLEQSFTDDLTHLEDLASATKIYRQNLLKHVIYAFEEISQGFDGILKKHGLEKMNICGGIHHGQALFDFFGDADRVEFDVVSLDMAFVARLEEFSKRLQLVLGAGHYLVLSQEACVYMDPAPGKWRPHEHRLTRRNGDLIRSFDEVERIYYLSFGRKIENKSTDPDLALLEAAV